TDTAAGFQDAGLVMPAFINAAAIFCCCVISVTATGPELSDRRMISGELVVLAERGKRLDGRAAQAGATLASSPGFCDRVPRTKRKFLGLIQRSSTLIRLLGSTPWRSRKSRTLLGISADSSKM